MEKKQGLATFWMKLEAESSLLFLLSK